MFSIIVSLIVGLAIGYLAAHFVNKTKLTAIKTQVGDVLRFTSVEARDLATKVHSLL